MALNKANLERLERERWSPISYSSHATSTLSSLSSVDHTRYPESFYSSSSSSAASHPSTTHNPRARGRSMTPRSRYPTQTPASSPVPVPPLPSLGRPSSVPSAPGSGIYRQTPIGPSTPTPIPVPPLPIFAPPVVPSANTYSPRIQIYKNPRESITPVRIMRSNDGSQSHTPVGRPLPFYQDKQPYDDPDSDLDSDSGSGSESDYSNWSASTLSSISDLDHDSYDGDYDDNSDESTLYDSFSSDGHAPLY